MDRMDDRRSLASTLPAGHASLGYVLFNGRLDAKAAAGPYLKSYEYGAGNADIGKIYYQRQQYQKALAFYDKEGSMLLQLKDIALCQHKLGASAKAKAALEKIRSDFGDSSLYQQAQILAQWDDIQAALASLEKARQTGDSGLVLARNDPLLAPLRMELRFQRLLRSMGFCSAQLKPKYRNRPVICELILGEGTAALDLCIKLSFAP
jgi:tetratricopeptide (TPR) repeat protein